MRTSSLGILGLLCVAAVLVLTAFAAPPQPDPIEERVARLEKSLEEQAKRVVVLEEQVAALTEANEQLLRWQESARAAAGTLNRAMDDVLVKGFTKASIPPASRERLVRALQDLSRQLVPAKKAAEGGR